MMLISSSSLLVPENFSVTPRSTARRTCVASEAGRARVRTRAHGCAFPLGGSALQSVTRLSSCPDYKLGGGPRQSRSAGAAVFPVGVIGQLPPVRAVGVHDPEV